MSRKVFLFLFILVLVALSAAALGVYRSYLAPSRLIPKARQTLEEALGYPIDLEDARIAGIGMVSFGAIRIPASDGSPGTEPWLTAESATLHLGLAKMIATGNLSLDISLVNPEIALRHDPVRGWNFLSGERTDRSSRERNGDPRETRSEPAGRSVDLSIRMEKPVVWIRDPERGECRIPFSETAILGFRSDKNRNSKNLTLQGEGLIHAKLQPALIDNLPPAFRDLVTLVGFAPNFSVGLEASLRGESWELASRRNPGIVLDSPEEESGLALSRFRFSGKKEAEGNFSLESAAIESATLQSSSWNWPAIERLKVPWTEPPRGALKLGIRNLRFDSERLQCSLSGIHIEETTLSIEALPWLSVLTPREGWGLSEIDLSGNLVYTTSDGAFGWDAGRIEFLGGKGGRIETSGSYTRTPQTEWSVAATVFDYPVPQAMVGEHQVSPGVLSGKMKWRESRFTGSEWVFLAEGSVRLEGGEIGAIRLFGGLDNLLEDEGILNSPFKSFGFAFDLKEDRIAIADLRLDSEILDLAGVGVYGPGRRLEMNLELRPTARLAENLKDAKSSLLASSIAESKDPLRVRATGNLENPEYSITFGEGMKIPIQGLNLQF